MIRRFTAAKRSGDRRSEGGPLSSMSQGQKSDALPKFISVSQIAIPESPFSHAELATKSHRDPTKRERSTNMGQLKQSISKATGPAAAKLS